MILTVPFLTDWCACILKRSPTSITGRTRVPILPRWGSMASLSWEASTRPSVKSTISQMDCWPWVNCMLSCLEWTLSTSRWKDRPIMYSSLAHFPCIKNNFTKKITDLILLFFSTALHTLHPGGTEPTLPGRFHTPGPFGCWQVHGSGGSCLGREIPLITILA